MISAILFDLDETLVAQEQAFREAYAAAGELAAEMAGVDAGLMAQALPDVAREAMDDSAAVDVVRRCCFGGRDVLWGDPTGESASLRQIASAAPGFRAAVWRRVLERQGVDDEPAAERIGYHFPEMMLGRMAAFAEVRKVLDQLAGRVRMGIVTNGMPAAQRSKLQRLGLERYFETVVASASVEVGKPAQAIFEHALERLGVGRDGAVMVGDSLAGDVAGAAKAGIRGVWVNRAGSAGGVPLPDGAVELPDLTALPPLVRNG